MTLILYLGRELDVIMVTLMYEPFIYFRANFGFINTGFCHCQEHKNFASYKNIVPHFPPNEEGIVYFCQ